jgi:RNA polymerase sigma-70 factor (ECF subfamily)
LQAVFVKIWQKAKSYHDNGSSPMTWLITLARNLCIDRLRAQKTTTVTSGDEVGGQAGQRPASEHAQTETFLSALDIDEAASVRSVYLEGDSYQDLAARAELPIDTMRTRLHRSLVKLNDGLSG